MKVQLLERGKFQILIDGKQYKGNFDMQAIENFCKLHNLSSIIDLGNAFNKGMLPSMYADFILCGIHRSYGSPEHCELKKENILAWIEEINGFNSNDFMKLVAQGIKTFLPVEHMQHILSLSDEEKKILGMRIAGSNSDTEQL